MECGVHREGFSSEFVSARWYVQNADDDDLETFSPVLFCTLYINDSVIGPERRGLTIRH